jgi:hypothetical protein
MLSSTWLSYIIIKLLCLTYIIYFDPLIVIASRSCTPLHTNLPGLEVISCVTLLFSYGCLQHTASERTFAVLGKRKNSCGARWGEHGACWSVGICLWTKDWRNEIALCTGAPSWCKSQPQVWDHNKSKVSGRCCNVRLCYLAAFTLRRNNGVGGTCSSTYGDQVVTSVFYTTKNASLNCMKENDYEMHYFDSASRF